MNLIRWGISFVLISLVVGCSSGGDDNTSGGGPIDKKSFPNKPNTIYGAWTMSESQTDQGITFFMSIYINDSSVGLEVTCAAPNQVVQVSSTVPATISNPYITIKQKMSVSQKVGDVTCSLNAQPTQLQYRLQGPDYLILTDMTSGETMTAYRQTGDVNMVTSPIIGAPPKFP